MSTTREIHNPADLSPEKFGAADGWRLLYLGEQVCDGDEVWEYGAGPWKRVNGSYAGTVIKLYATHRTRRPDPFATKPAGEWIKMSERVPTAADYPIWGHDQDAPEGIARTWYMEVCPPLVVFTHWRHAEKVPKPPARELTQAEKDEAMWKVVHRAGDANGWRGIFDATLKAERAEISKLIEAVPHNMLRPTLRARVNGGAK